MITIWQLEQSRLTDMLKRAAAGESIDVILLDVYANSEHEYIREGDDE